MILEGNFANFYDFSTNFCQLADFLPEGGGPRIFVKYSPVEITLLIGIILRLQPEQSRCCYAEEQLCQRLPLWRIALMVVVQFVIQIVFSRLIPDHG